MRQFILVKYLNLSLRLFNLLNRLKETIKIDGTKIGEKRLNIEERIDVLSSSTSSNVF
uniref:Uncharacterized protein n=1 Tax=Meloidogyne enterolobii TaxID=390850 RepID=A0A6V7TWW0_MELEN|nr:unnamed protein product [Meloidogyne enterolobii]